MVGMWLLRLISFYFIFFSIFGIYFFGGGLSELIYCKDGGKKGLIQSRVVDCKIERLKRVQVRKAVKS